VSPSQVTPILVLAAALPRRLDRKKEEETVKKATLKLAYKLLVNDKSKFTALLLGITFAVFLMMFVTSMFSGVLNHASATVINIGASMWVMDPAVQTVSNSVGMPDYVLDAVRSIPGVQYAVPLYSGGALVKLSDGTYQAVTVIGLDDTSLLGRPELSAGKIEDIYAESGFIAVQDAEFSKLESPHMGSELELNDYRGVIVGIGKVTTVWFVRHSNPVHHLRARHSVHPESPLHDLVRARRAEERKRHTPDQAKQVEALGYQARTKKSSCRELRTSTSTKQVAVPTCSS
jgi:putative ABC transport system permease protein